MASEETIERVLSLLVQSRPGAVLPSDAVKAYVWVLEPIPDELLLQAAAMAARSSGDFLPSAGTLFQAALELADPEPPADEVWPLVLKHAANASRVPNPVELPDRAARALAAIGGDAGWLESEFPFRRREFVEAYAALRARERREAALALPEGERKGLLGDGH